MRRRPTCTFPPGGNKPPLGFGAAAGSAAGRPTERGRGDARILTGPSFSAWVCPRPHEVRSGAVCSGQLRPPPHPQLPPKRGLPGRAVPERRAVLVRGRPRKAGPRSTEPAAGGRAVLRWVSPRGSPPSRATRRKTRPSSLTSSAFPVPRQAVSSSGSLVNIEGLAGKKQGKRMAFMWAARGMCTGAQS